MNRSAREIIVPYIPGDGIGPEIMAVARRAMDSAVAATESDSVRIRWDEVLAGAAAYEATGSYMPESVLQTIRSRGVAIKGPLATPVGGGYRSLNVSLRQALDLYASVRPVRHFEGVPSPMKDPSKVNLVIFRENTEDVYKGIEWMRGSAENTRLMTFLRDEMGVEVASDSSLGLKPMSETASKRLVRAAIKFAVSNGRRRVTLVHKGNIMKFTEGAFRDWGYEVARDEFPGIAVSEMDVASHGPGLLGHAQVVINDRIADNMFQQVLTRPEEYSVLATPNLNGDYLADACAAQVGGLGVAPGANLGDGVAVFEPVHGTAPKYAGRGLANPCAIMLSGAMMLEHIGLEESAARLVDAISGALSDGVLTQDLARMAGTARCVGTREFGEDVVSRLGSL